MPDKKFKKGSAEKAKAQHERSRQFAGLHREKAVIDAADPRVPSAMLNAVKDYNYISIKGKFQNWEKARAFFTELKDRFPEGVPSIRWECNEPLPQNQFNQLAYELQEGWAVERLAILFPNGLLGERHIFSASTEPVFASPPYLDKIHVSELRMFVTPLGDSSSTVSALLQNPHLRNVDLTLPRKENGLPSREKLQALMDRNVTLETVAIDYADKSKDKNLAECVGEISRRTSVNKLLNQAYAHKAKYDVLPDDDLTAQQVQQAETHINAFTDFFNDAISLSEKFDNSKGKVRTAYLRLLYAANFPEGLPADPKPDLLNVVSNMKQQDIDFDMLNDIVTKLTVDDALYLLAVTTEKIWPRTKALLEPICAKLMVPELELTREQQTTRLALMFAMDSNPFGDTTHFLPMFAHHMGMKGLQSGLTAVSLQAAPHTENFQRCMSAVRAEVARLKLPRHLTRYVVTNENREQMLADLSGNPTVTHLELSKDYCPAKPLIALLGVDKPGGRPKNTAIASLKINCESLWRRAAMIPELCEKILAHNTSIKNLKLLYAQGSQATMSALLEMLETNSTLESLEVSDLSCHNLDASIQGLASNNTLQTLVLRDCYFGEPESEYNSPRNGMQRFAAGLAVNTSLVRFDLRGTEGAGCSVKGPGMAVLAEAIGQNQGLREVLLPNLENGAVNGLIDLVRNNPRLERLQTQSIWSASDQEIIDLANALADHPNLQHIELRLNALDVAVSAGTLDYLFAKIASIDNLQSVNINIIDGYRAKFTMTNNVIDGAAKLIERFNGSVHLPLDNSQRQQLIECRKRHYKLAKEEQQKAGGDPLRELPEQPRRSTGR